MKARRCLHLIALSLGLHLGGNALAAATLDDLLTATSWAMPPPSPSGCKRAWT